MNKKVMAALSVVCMLGAVVGLEQGGLSTVIVSLLALAVGILGAKKSIFG